MAPPVFYRERYQVEVTLTRIAYDGTRKNIQQITEVRTFAITPTDTFSDAKKIYDSAVRASIDVSESLLSID